MAVENKYVSTNITNAKKETAALIHGAALVTAVQTFEVAAADDDGSIYRVFKNVPADLIPIDFKIFNDAITAGTDWDLGLYETREDGQGGAVIDKDCFVDGADLSSGNGRGSALEGLSASPVAIENATKRIYEIGGQTLETKKRGYDIAFTANTVGSAAGTITLVCLFVQG